MSEICRHHTHAQTVKSQQECVCVVAVVHVPTTPLIISCTKQAKRNRINLSTKACTHLCASQVNGVSASVSTGCIELLRNSILAKLSVFCTDPVVIQVNNFEPHKAPYALSSSSIEFQITLLSARSMALSALKYAMHTALDI
jgi:hypothetical protein